MLDIFCYYREEIEDEGMEDEAEMVPVLRVCKVGKEDCYNKDTYQKGRYKTCLFPSAYEYDEGVDALGKMLEQVQQYRQGLANQGVQELTISAYDHNNNDELSSIARFKGKYVSSWDKRYEDRGFVNEIHIELFLSITQIWYLYLKSGIQESMTFYVPDEEDFIRDEKLMIW